MTNHDYHLAEPKKLSVSMSDFDAETYLPMLEVIDLDEGQRLEYLGIIWSMMRMCVEMNIATESWGQIVSGVICNACADSPGIETK